MIAREPKADLRLFRLSRIVAFWSLAALGLTASFWVTAWISGRPVAFLPILWKHAVCCALWAVATPLVLKLSRRFSFTGAHWRRSLAIHLVFSVFFVLAVLVVFVAIDALWHWFIVEAFQYVTMLKMMIHMLFNALFVYYWFIIVLQHALLQAEEKHLAELKIATMEKDLEVARLKTLMMQIQPHFLFNTLNTLSSLIRLDRKEEASTSLAEFAELMRFSLKQADRAMVTVAEEVGFVRNYLQLEARRHRNADFAVTAEADCLALLMPTFLLQPIVENAVRHGIAGKPNGLIQATIHRDHCELVVQVRDYGTGVPMNFSWSEHAGVGLNNVRSRLQAHFGNKAHLMVQAKEVGSLVSIRLPVMEPKHD